MMGLVFKVKTKDWPIGLAHLIVSALFKKYQPQDMIMCRELQQRKLNKIKMKISKDLMVKLLKQLIQIKKKYNTAAFTSDERPRHSRLPSGGPDHLLSRG